MQNQSQNKNQTEMKHQNKRRMIKMLIGVGILFGLIFIYKLVGLLLFKHYMAANAVPTISVSAMKVSSSEWQPVIKASSSLRAIRGVNVTTELAGMVRTIYFKPGATVNSGTLLVQLNADSDIAQLHALQASAALAVITYTRDKAQYAVHAVSKQTVDTDAANVKNLNAQVAQQVAIVNKKTIRAPFTGRLGINQVNPGQFLNPGDAIVTLQTLHPIYADFFVPQQALARLKVGQQVILTSDSFPGRNFYGKVTTINPAVDVNSRNVEVEATIANPKSELTPGMFATAEVYTGKAEPHLTLPMTAVSFNPYGEIVYIINQTGTDKKGQAIMTVMQSFVTTGETRGDQVAITRGIKAGDLVVTSGQLKLKNGSRVAINNSIVPSNNPAPNAPNER